MNNKIQVNSFILHIIAMVSMLADHLWKSCLPEYDILSYIGRIAFPIFAFMLVEGFYHTKNRSKYLSRMIIFALLSEIPFNLFVSNHIFYPLAQNVLWTFVIGIIMMITLEKYKDFKKSSSILKFSIICMLFSLLATVLFTDYGGNGVLMILLFYLSKRYNLPKIVQLLGMIFINCSLIKSSIISIFGISLPLQASALLALIFIWSYNGKQGYYNKYIKYIYYFFYPVHLLLLALI